AVGEPRRGHVHLRVLSVRPEQRRAGLNVLELSVDLREARARILRRLRDVVHARAVPAAAEIERRGSLPGVAFVTEAELVEQTRRQGIRPSRAVEVRVALHIADEPGRVIELSALR